MSLTSCFRLFIPKTKHKRLRVASSAGYQILLGVGLGMVFQTAFFPIQWVS